MKTLQKILATILLGAACSSCDLTLIPEDTVTPQTFFKTETDLRLWTNQFYTMLESPETPPASMPTIWSTRAWAT